MQISAAIGAEAMFFVASVLEGVGLVLVYDIFRIIRRVMKHGNIWISMEDIVYWLFCTISVFLLLYRENDGLMRAFSFLGILLGSVTYYFLFSRFVIKIGVLGKVWSFKWQENEDGYVRMITGPESSASA